MNDENLPEAQAAFERLSDQAAGLDTMAARRAIEKRSRRRRQNIGVLAVASAAIVAIIGFVVFRPDDPDQDVATDPSTSTSTTSTAVPTTTVPVAPATETRSIAEFLAQQGVGDDPVAVSAISSTGAAHGSSASRPSSPKRSGTSVMPPGSWSPTTTGSSTPRSDRLMDSARRRLPWPRSIRTSRSTTASCGPPIP